VLVVPDDTDHVAATIVEPLSCVFNGQEYLDIGAGDSVLIYGTGPIGVMHGLLARAAGAAPIMITDVRPERLKLAEQFGFDAYIGPEDDVAARARALTGGDGPDVVITACPSGEAQMQAIELVATHGRVSLFGGLPKDRSKIQFDSNKVHYKEISVFGSFASHSIQYLKCMKLIDSGGVDVSRIITHTFDLDHIADAFAAAAGTDALKVVVTMA